MNNQPDLFSLDQARRARDHGMERAIDHADRAHDGWREEAYQFLVEFAQRRSHFISEDVSSASKLSGLAQPPTDRAWGSIYRRAVKSGIIIQDGTGRSARRHASICPRWKSLVWCHRVSMETPITG